MRIMQWMLAREGYRVVNIGYPSTQAGITDLSEKAVSRAVARCAGAPRIHFITHSLGGILLRSWMSRNTPDHAGRVVMLGPPNGGSELVDAFRHRDSFKLIFGRAGQELCARRTTVLHSLPCTAPLETGIIAGTRSANPLTSVFVGGPNDGKVSVKSAFDMPAKAKRQLPVSHTWMMMDRTVIAASARFLQKGDFNQ